ncbi:NAD-dependent epimerase/dehydratase family protein, partial [Candidatus Woesearchaeota archaeon]|nr:NAD-dependent epimerase/dehydratase family protein [Candidatus Woesearchaeota archaeon]
MKTIKNKKIIITGGAGFIGCNLARELCNDNEVSVIDDLSTGKIANLHDVRNKIKFLRNSVTDLKLLKKEFKNCDYVLHQAAIPSVEMSINDPVKINRNNIDGTLNVLLAARDAGVKRVVYAASCAAYGNLPDLPKKEDMPVDPESPYAISKLCGEYYLKTFHDIYGLKSIGLRYFNVFGPYQDPNSHYSAVIPLFIKAVLKNKSPTIFGDGLQSRDFSYIDNNIHANILACLAKNKKAFGQTVNIACGERINLLQLLKLINKIEGKNIKPKFAKPRPGDVKHSLADISLAKKLIGYNQIVRVPKGIKKT